MLEKEAEEWSFRKKYTYGYSYTFKQVLDAYIDGAKSREKCITDFEATNKKISDECHKLVDSLEKKQNEVAELKAQIESERDLSAIAYQQGAESYKQKADKQLTKAKEIILKLYNAGRDVLMCRAEEKAYDRLDEAINDRSIAQFLKEVEK